MNRRIPGQGHTVCHWACPACKGAVPLSPFLHLSCVLCGLLWLRTVTPVPAPIAPPAFPALSCTQCPHAQEGQSQQLWPACQVPAGTPGHSEGTDPSSPAPAPSFPVWTQRGGIASRSGGLADTSARPPALACCTPRPAANSTPAGSHPLLTTTVQPGKGDLSLPQACKPQSHTRSWAPGSQ